MDDTRRRQSLVFVVGSGGELEPDDAMKVTHYPGTRPTLFTHSMHEFFESHEMRILAAAAQSLPNDCGPCCWRNVCGGSAGRLVNRFSAEKGFDNKSILCEGLQDLYSSVYLSLIKSGTDQSLLEQAVVRELGFSRASELESPRKVFSLKMDAREIAKA